MNKFHDDGNWKWIYECKYVSPTTNPKDWYYKLAFTTKDGGYMTGDEITCSYYDLENRVAIYNGDKGGLKFYVENFHDISIILKPLIKQYDAKPYPIYESLSSVRKKKLKKINKKSI